MKIDLAIIVALVAVLVATPSRADVCHQPVCNAPVVAVQSYLPLYGAGLAYAAPGDGETNRLLAELIAEMRAMNAKLDALAGTAAPPPVEGLASVAVQKAMAVNCALCHTGDKSKGEVQLFTDKGEPVKLSGPTKKAMEKALAAGTMPPADKVKMTGVDRELIRKALASK